MITSSRQMFAFARDGALPGSKYLYHINPSTKTPVNCVWTAAFIGYLLGLLTFAGPGAINAIFSLSVSGQYVSYTIPIASRFIFKNNFRSGPFTLGRWVWCLSITSAFRPSDVSHDRVFPSE